MCNRLWLSEQICMKLWAMRRNVCPGDVTRWKCMNTMPSLSVTSPSMTNAQTRSRLRLTRLEKLIVLLLLVNMQWSICWIRLHLCFCLELGCVVLSRDVINRVCMIYEESRSICLIVLMKPHWPHSSLRKRKTKKQQEFVPGFQSYKTYLLTYWCELTTTPTI